MANVKNEVLGSSKGVAGQTFTVTGTHVSLLEIWINELPGLYKKEVRRIVRNGKLEVKEVHDKGGNIVEFWIKWRAVKNLYESTKDGRCYEVIIDDSGRVTISFGNGRNGAIPPSGEGNIRATYREGAGGSGNIPEEVAKKLCQEIRSNNRHRWYSWYWIWCWGCLTFSRGNPARMCFSNRPGNRGCSQVNRRYEQPIVS